MTGGQGIFLKENIQRHVFSFLSIQTGQGWARAMHLLCAYWGLVVMSLHIGFHFSMVTGMIRKHIGEQFQGISGLFG